MSSLPPPGAKREPLAKSAPATRALTKAGISVGSAEPSASNMTMTSPVAAAKPQAMALPLPLRVWVIARTHGRVRRAARGDRGQDDLEVARLVAGRYDDADGRERRPPRLGARTWAAAQHAPRSCVPRAVRQQGRNNRSGG